MTQLLPSGAPQTAREAFAYIAAITAPTVDDLKIMVLLEAAAKGLYDDLAAAASDRGVSDLLTENGREELGHAYRVRQVIEKLTGENFPVPSLEQNPYYEPVQDVVLTKDMLANLVGLELDGETLYGSWASSLGDVEAAKLLRLNAREERGHSERMQKAVERLAT